MRAAIYNKFWQSMGGGERHSGMIAEILSQSGVEVDLIGHTNFSLDELGDRLALDLGKTSLIVTPDRGEQAASELSEDYDLFVNATYMSRVVSRARRSVYLCFFPTPVDSELDPVRRAALRLVGPRLQRQPNLPRVRYGVGWYPPEGGRRRQWAWSSGDAVIGLEPGPAVDLSAAFGRPGSSEPVTARALLGDQELTSFPVTAGFTTRVVPVPLAGTRREIRFVSETFSPGPDDPRSLGIAVSRLRLGGTPASLSARIAGRFPWLLMDPENLAFVESYDLLLANSAYTQGWIERLWQARAEILYPPIEHGAIRASAERSKTILTVGRFFAPGHGHSKRQLEMVRMFGEQVRAGALPGWRLVVVGGCEPRQRAYLEQVRAAAAGLPVEIHANAPRSLVESYMSTASIFWSATGLGEDTDKRPWTNEHFGMTTAEAMVGGCVPVVIDRAGQQEIVRDGVDGFRWNSAEQWRIRTVQVATDDALRARLAAAASQRARQFSDDAFRGRWNELATTYELIGP